VPALDAGRLDPPGAGDDAEPAFEPAFEPVFEAGPVDPAALDDPALVVAAAGLGVGALGAAAFGAGGFAADPGTGLVAALAPLTGAGRAGAGPGPSFAGTSEITVGWAAGAAD
jgi:hypothetical protein